MARPAAIGILGGTFDPVHVGHLVAAVNVRHELALDKVLLVVANEPWQKSASRPVTPAGERLAVLEAALGGIEGLEASAIEIERGGPSYSADTVAELRRRHPEAELHLIVGADAAAGLHTWERVEELRDAVTLVVVNRPGTAIAVATADPSRAGGVEWGRPVRLVEVPALEISSTDLRERAASGRPLDYLVPPDAIRQIRRRGLYAHDR